MSQQSVFSFLKQNEGLWFCAREISACTGDGFQAVMRAVKMLERSGFVVCERRLVRVGGRQLWVRFARVV